MTGGACNADGTTGINANPMTNMMETMIMGDAKARQMAEGYAGQNAQGMAMNANMM